MKHLGKIGKVYKKEKEKVWISVPKKNLINTCEKLKTEYGVRRIISISGYDTGRNIEVIYHFELGHGVLNLKIKVSKKSNKIKSITPVFKSANLFERELFEMLGLDITGHPNLKKLFLPKEINTPLRKGDKK